MKSEIVRGDKLNREVWQFELHTDYVRAIIWFNTYSVEYRDNPRQRVWRRSGLWTRLGRRSNTIQEPQLPREVEDEMRAEFTLQVSQLRIVK